MGYEDMTRVFDIRGTLALNNGTTIPLTASKINSYTIAESNAESGIPLGTSNAASYSIDIDNRQKTLVQGTLDGAKVTLEIGIKSGNSYVYSPFGEWYVEDFSLPEQSVLATLTGADALATAFEVPFEDDPEDYPKTLSDLYEDVCDLAGVQYRSSSIINGTQVISEMPEWPEGVTLRMVAGYIATCAGGFVRIARDGICEIIPFGQTPTRQIGTSVYRSFSPQNGAAFSFNCLQVQYWGSEEIHRYAVTSGIEDTALNTIQVSDNPLLTEAMVQNVVTSLRGLTAIGAVLEWGFNPIVTCGDKMIVTDKSNTVHTMLINSQDISFNGGLIASSVCNLPSLSVNRAESYGNRAGLLDANGYINPARIKDLNGAIESSQIIQEALERLDQAEQDLADDKDDITEINTRLDGESGEASIETLRTEYNQLSGTVSQHTTAINANTSAIALKADSSTVDTLSGVVSNHTTELEVQAGEISGKVGMSEVNTAIGNIHEFHTESSISLTENKFEVNSPNIEFNAGGNQTLRMDGDGAVMDYLTVNKKLIAPGLDIKYTGPTSITVGSGGNFSTLQAAFDTLSCRIVIDDVTISILNDLTEFATLSSVLGSGRIYIQGNSHTLSGQLKIVGCYAEIEIESLDVIAGSQDGAVNLKGDGHVLLYLCVIDGGGNVCIDIRNGTKANIIETQLFNAYELITLGSTSDLDAMSLSGGDVNSTYLTSNGGRWTWNGTRPAGTYYEASASLHSPSNPDTMLSVDTGGTAPTPSGPIEVTNFTATNTGCFGNSDWNNGVEPREGMYGDVNYKGCIWFDLSALAYRSVQNARLTLTRISGAGGSSPVTVYLWTTPSTGASGGTPVTGATYRAELGTIGNGERISFEIPVAAVTALFNSQTGARTGGLMLYAENEESRARGYSANYSKYGSSGADAPVLTVTYQ